MIEAGREYSAEVMDIALPSGHGVARLGNLVVFIPGAVPGDKVRVRIGKLRNRFAYGEIVRIEEESPHRQQPRCPHFGRCGGCDLQALPYDLQLRIKEHHLSQVLTRIAGKDLEGVAQSPIVPSVEEFFYRSKVEFSFSQAGGKAAVGLSERLSPLRPSAGRIVPVEGCALFSPAAAEALPLVREMIDESDLKAYDPLTGKGTLKRLVLREAKGTGEIMMHLVAGPDVSRHLDRMKKKLLNALPQLKSLYATSGGGTRLLWGAPAIEEKISGLSLRVYPLSFFQPNPRTAAELYARILRTAGIRGTESVLGLYCGVGPIELFLARHVKEVTGIDSSEVNIACARENSMLNRSENCLFIRERAERAARHCSKDIDLIVIDPPRSGISSDAHLAIRGIRPEKIVYISCDPSTLARDLRSLSQAYRPREIIPFDFFPHTAHLEVLTLLERR